MKKALIIALLSLVAMAGQARRKVEVPLLKNYPCADMNTLPLHGGDVLIKGRIVAPDSTDFMQYDGQIYASLSDYINDIDGEFLFDVREDGTFSLNLHVPYPMFVYVVPFDNVYACPGDTVELTVDFTKLKSGDGVIIDGTGLSGEVSKLAQKIDQKYCDFSAECKKRREYAEQVELTPDSTLAWKDKQVALLDDMVRKMNAGLPELEGCSPMASDIIRTHIVAEYMSNIYDCIETDDAEELLNEEDFWQKFFSYIAPREQYLMDNPLMMIAADWVFFNQTESFLMGIKYVTMEEKAALNMMHDKLGLSPTDFTLQVCMVRFLSAIYNHFAAQPNEVEEMVARKLSCITYPHLTRQAVLAYHKHILDHEVKAVGEAPMTKADSIFQRIIEPYKGNVLFVDFWEMFCVPCRAKMLNMRDEVEANKDKPVKYLFITDDPERMCRHFLEPNNVKGEHIFITKSEWGYMKEKFQFSSIPHIELFDKNGKQRKNTTIEELLKE